MTAVNIDWGPLSSIFSTMSAQNTLNLDDADNSVGLVFRVKKAGTINKIGINVTEFTGSPPQYNVGLVIVDNSGNPTTTAYGTSATQLWQPTGTGMVWITLATPAVVANVNIGDVVCARIWPGASAPDGSNHIHITREFPLLKAARIPHVMVYTVAWAASSGFGITVAYSDDEAIFPLANDGNTGSFNINSDPDEIGCLFQVPFDCICVGAKFRFRGYIATVADCNIKLYDAADTVLATVFIDESNIKTALDEQQAIKWAPITLTANTNYRLTMQPTSVNGTGMTQLTCYDAASRQAIYEGSRWQRTHRTNAGAWTQDATKLPLMALILSDITITTPAPPSSSSVPTGPSLGFPGAKI